LLKEAWIWAIPSATCFFTFFFVRVCLAIRFSFARLPHLGLRHLSDFSIA
jgi:hypothetical protein